ncbi:MAG: hypothetical protein GTO08_08835 [Deltaproteobacteria bacterium]|nr:hypothetical protein [Deltaproteobacteria bacterium]
MKKESAEKIIEEYFGNNPEEKKLLDLLCELNRILGEIPDPERISEVLPNENISDVAQIKDSLPRRVKNRR